MENLALAKSHRKLWAVRLGLATGLALLFIMALLWSLQGVRPALADPGMLYVDGATGSDTGDCQDPAAPCQTIGYAISQAVGGDSIRVTTGTYTENLTINISVTLMGGYESADWTRSITQYETIIDGSSVISQPVVTVQSSSDGTVLDGLTITGGNGDSAGGVDASDASVTIRNCLIRDNFADGSPHSWAGGGVISSGRLTILDTLIVGNEVNEGASGVRLGGGGSHLTMINTLVANNRGAEGLHLNGGANLMNVTIANNAAGTGRPGINHNPEFGEPVVLVNSIIYDNGWGDAIHVPDPNLIQATYSDIEGGWTGTGNIDAAPQFVDAANGDYHLQAWSPAIDAGTAGGAPDHDFEGDPRPQNAGYDMGADEFVGTPIPPARLYVDGATGSDTADCVNPTAPCATIGYALTRAGDGDTILIATGTFTENLTITGIAVTLRGGYTISGTLWITGTGETIVNGNNADRVFLIHDSNSVLENLTITGGDAPADQCWGGGVWITNGDVTIRSSTITGNGDNCGSGGIGVNHDWGPAHLTLESSIVSDNTSGGPGSGLHVWGGDASAEVRDVTFVGNTSGDVGGGIGIDNSSSAVIVDTRILSNTAGHGGGGIMVDGNARAQIANVVIEHNEADYGGGIAVRTGASAFISDTRVISNTANESGGGIGIWHDGPAVVMANTVISDNYGVYAGGMSMWEPGGTFTGTNLLVVDNRSGPGPAGIGLGGSGQLMNVTVAGNDSATGFDGAEIEGPAGGFPIVNSIFWGNGTDGANLSGSNLDVSYSNVERGWPGTGNVSEDPLFVDVPNGDYHPQVGSPCIDAGTPAGAPTHDIEGTPRDAAPDMGAYEWGRFHIFLPLTLRNYGP